MSDAQWFLGADKAREEPKLLQEIGRPLSLTHTFVLGGILARALIGAAIGAATVLSGDLALSPLLVASAAGASLGGYYL